MRVRRFLDVADALESVLAGFVSHERRQLPAVRADGLGDLLQRATRSAPRPRAPFGEGRPRRGDGVAHLFAARALKPAEQDAGVDRAAILELARRADLLSADQQRITSAESRLDLLDRAIELAVQILHAVRGHRGVRDLRRALRVSVSWHHPFGLDQRLVQESHAAVRPA